MRQFVYTLAFASMLLFAASGTAQAQTTGRVEVKVPFSFYAGTTLLPAGTYFIDNDPAQEPVMEIDSAQGQAKAYLLTEQVDANRAPSDSHLTFDAIGGKQFLSQVWTQGELTGYQLPETSLENRLERQALEQQDVAPARMHPVKQ